MASRPSKFDFWRIFGCELECVEYLQSESGQDHAKVRKTEEEIRMYESPP